jgi:Phytanoyl-CoA dioxygenase (PhyH)
LPRGAVKETAVSQTSILTPEQRVEFDRRGVLRLPGFYANDDISQMADRLWADLERRFGILRDRPETWTVGNPAHFQGLKRSGAFNALGSTKLSELADAMLGEGNWDAPSPRGGPLVTFPTPTPHLTRPPWHLDIGGLQRLSPLPILRVFTFLEPAPPNGGGTLYVAGSHQLALEIERDHDAPVRSAYVRERLRRDHVWFASLLAARSADLRELMGAEAQVGSHTVQVEEMTGAPGDLIVMHPAILHGTAHNALDHPRMMLTEWIYRRG